MSFLDYYFVTLGLLANSILMLQFRGSRLGINFRVSIRIMNTSVERYFVVGRL
jgi:hypothetical protein